MGAKKSFRKAKIPPLSLQHEKQRESESKEERKRASTIMIALKHILPNPYNPRHPPDDEGIKELMESVEAQGLICPPLVTPRKIKGELKYVAVAGERRIEALKRLGWERLPVVVRNLTNEQILETALVENLQREDLLPHEEALGYKRLMDELGLTQEEIAQKIGKTQAYISDALSFFSLSPELREQIITRVIKLSRSHIRLIARMGNERQQLRLAKRVSEGRLTVRQLEDRTREIKLESRERGKKVGVSPKKSADVFIDIRTLPEWKRIVSMLSVAPLPRSEWIEAVRSLLAAIRNQNSA